MRYEITIQEVRSMTVTVEADSKEEAEAKFLAENGGKVPLLPDDESWGAEIYAIKGATE